MNRIIPNFLVAALLTGSMAWAADDQAVPLEVTTLDDDLRAGGDVLFLLKMSDGVVQRTSINRGTRLADNSSSQRPVAPKSPYQWADVTEFGLQVRLHPGDGGLQQPDKWKVRLKLRGPGGNCEPRQARRGRACFGERAVEFFFDRNTTQMAPIRSSITPCSNDIDCNGGNFCGTRLSRCAVGDRGANPAGCLRLPSPQPACSGGARCDEEADRCETACATPDKDGDGEDSVECGGADCDDNDRNRAPGHTEVCDANDVDEDCDPTTFGKRDADNDGYFDAACRNISR
jgi:hypothetical protein